MIFALMVQPLVALNIPSVFAVSPVDVDGIVVNEFSSETPNSDWVELYNTTATAVSLNGWKLRDSSSGGNPNIANLSGDLAGHSYRVVDVNNRLDKAGDVITIFKNNNNQASVSYGNASGSVVDAPGVGQTAGLVGGEWQVFNTPTPNAANQANVITPVVEPTLSFVANYHEESASWGGISVEINTPNMTDAKKVTVSVARDNGDPDVWVSDPANTNVTGALNGANHVTTAPIVLREGTRTQNSSSSWLTSSPGWTNYQTPGSVTVIVERLNGTQLEDTVQVGTALGVTWADISATLPVPEEPLVVPHKVNYTVLDDDRQGWGFSGDGEFEFIASNGGTGQGALQFSTSESDDDIMVYQSLPDDEKFLLRNLDAYNLSYQSKRLGGVDRAAPVYGLYLENLEGMGPRWIIFEPTYNAPSNHDFDQWSTWSLSLASKFWHTAGAQVQVTGTEFSEAHPNAVVSYIAISQGTSNAGYVTQIDNVVTHKGIYEFEPTAVPDTTAPTVSNISISPMIDGNIGGTVTVRFDLDDATGVDASRTRVIFANKGSVDSNHKYESVKNPTHIGGNHYEVTFDTKSFVSANHTGFYGLGFNPYDTLGNQTSSKPVAFNAILVDNSGPSFSLRTPVSGSHIRGTQEVVFDVSDHTGVSETNPGYAKLVNVSDGQEQSRTLVKNSAGDWSAIFDTAVLDDGEYRVDIRPIDSFGTARFNSDRGRLVVDNAAPVISNLELNGSEPKVKPNDNGEAFDVSGVDFVNGVLNISADISDGQGSGIKKVYNAKLLRLNESGHTSSGQYKQSFNMSSSDGVTWTGNVDTKNPDNVAADGLYQIFFNAEDKVGNVSSARINVYVDNTAPVASISSHDDGDDVSGQITLIGNVDDVNPMNTFFAINGPNGYAKSDLKRDGSLEHELDWDVSELPNGEYSVRFETRDQAGNKTTVSTKRIKLNVNNPQPLVLGENFNTNNNEGYRGLNVGFSIANFVDVSWCKG